MPVPEEEPMKTFAYLFIIAALFMMGNGPLSAAVPEVTLDASQVTGARDIEMAIDRATGNGAHPGIVTLDSRKGKFIYTADDRSINIYTSNVTLRSLNGATITNCDDGVFFDNTPANNIVIEGLRFVCLPGHAVIAPYPGQHRNVVLRHNTFEVGNAAAVDVLQGESWTIGGNQILSAGSAIVLNETSQTIIRDNEIRGNIGVDLSNSGTDNRVTNNRITAWWQGLVLRGESYGNKFTANQIDSVQQSGIALTDIVAGNQVTGNRIACWPGIQCQAVDAVPLNYEQNKIAGNTIVKSK
jgi:hypothetical protein